jgi:nucleoside 2-deoxyribosyltransferase
MKIYLAGKWADRANIRTIMDSLEAKGHTITHDWTSHENENDRSPEYLKRCAHLDIEGVRNAELIIVLMTDPKYAYRGSFTEIGAAVALRKHVHIVCPDPNAYCRTNCFFFHPLIIHHRQLSEVPDL